MKKLTVFTPTYNRAYCLHVCYESLKRQTSKDFIWSIIDDGSTDNTGELVAGWIAKNEITIRYHRQDNQGMHGAHNTAYRLIDTELNVCLDSCSSFFIRSMTAGGWTMICLMRASISSPLLGFISNFLFLASAKNAGSCIVFMYASRRIFTRSGGIPGGP